VSCAFMQNLLQVGLRGGEQPRMWKAKHDGNVSRHRRAGIGSPGAPFGPGGEGIEFGGEPTGIMHWKKNLHSQMHAVFSMKESSAG